jgi:hypothetical protein
MGFKHPSALPNALTIFALILASSALHACASASTTPFVIALPDAYYLQRDRDSQIALRRGGREVIRGPIAAYGVDREIVAGCVGESPQRSFSYPNDRPFPDSPACRYFILDASSGRLETDMDPVTWRARLGEIGVPSLEIRAPLLPE